LAAAGATPVLRDAERTVRGEVKRGARVCPERDGRVLFARNRRATVGSDPTADDNRIEKRPRWAKAFTAQTQVVAWCTLARYARVSLGPNSLSRLFSLYEQ
jgi:hypothetical protein